MAATHLATTATIDEVVDGKTYFKIKFINAEGKPFWVKYLKYASVRATPKPIRTRRKVR